MTPAGIEPATFGFVTQDLNHCATEVSYSGLGIENLSAKAIQLQAWTGQRVPGG